MGVYDIFPSLIPFDLEEKIVINDSSDPAGNEEHHGMSTAGIISAVPNNGVATAGVGYHTRVALFDICDFDNWLQEAEIYNLKLINLSSTCSPERDEVLQFINSGGVLVLAAGSQNHAVIANIPGVINVHRCTINSDENYRLEHWDYQFYQGTCLCTK